MKSAESAGERTRQAVIVCPPEGGDPLRVVGGLALIERGLRQLCDLGIDEIVIVIPQGRPAPRPSARITASVRIVQGQQSGTGQMAGDAAPWITDRCIVTTGDLVVDQRVLRWLCEQPTNVMVRTEDTGGLLAALDRSTLASNDMQSVAAVSLDTFPTYWASMRGDVPVHVLRVATNADAEHAWRVLIDHVDKRAKDLPALLFDPPFENFLVRRLAPTRITPNQITLFTTLLGFFVAWLFWQGWLGLGVALAIVVEVLDGVDGKLARLKRMTSRLGEFEHVLDFFYETSWYVALGHAFSRSVTWGWPAAALICVADLADNLAYIHHRRTTAGANLDEATPWLLRFRLVAGRRNIYMWLLLVGLVLASARAAFAFAAGWAFLTAAVHWQQSLVLARPRKRALESPSREGHVVEEAQRQRAPS
jgi:phosphatidylglycerophosphate synthase